MAALQATDQHAMPSLQTRRRWRQERLRLWHQWLECWHALGLAPALYEAIRTALETARQAQPNHLALRVAQAAYSRAQRTSRGQEDMLKPLQYGDSVAKRYTTRRADT